jgi:hypothetical protein
VVFEPIRLLMLGLHMAGPNLTPETFEAGMFAYPPSGGTSTGGHVSFGNRGIHVETDYQAVDDMVEIWWDAEAEGIDEQGNHGKGMMRFSDGGQAVPARRDAQGPCQPRLRSRRTPRRSARRGAARRGAPRSYPSPAGRRGLTGPAADRRSARPTIAGHG